MTTKTKVSYKDVKKEAAKPKAEREAIVQGRNGERRIPRRYDLSQKRVTELRKNADGDFPNPYRKGGVYHGFVQALVDLGLDKAHSFADVKESMQKVMGAVERGDTTAWKVFADRAPKPDAANPKDLNGRIMQTATVIQRLTGVHPYGLKLAQMKSCVDILAGKDGQPLYKLHTGFSKTDRVRPVNDLKGKRGRKTK